ncbi:betaine aldehyde dehydrogenase 1 [Hibiscus syriacus]|uniref:Betaine aldehyde dehydrogenase 1 n=1 Tax=Hibiscus syriacus TaxID=106335 RepID=A0A6A3BTY8_HIBSY|nr:uncharacterized protein LOC120211809 [Hibiscus syriacus]KAE8718928.1 betaine aldehyde dehydrogenase 1 [Hibiscus syriacus]
MEGNNSYGYGSSWADQWDTSNPEAPTQKKTGGGATVKYKLKVGDGLEKTKSAASAGMKKVKQGTSSGIQWIKASIIELPKRSRSSLLLLLNCFDLVYSELDSFVVLF